MALRSEQARILRRRLFARLGIALLIFTLGYVIFLVLMQWFWVPQFADRVADSTAPWYESSRAEYEEIRTSGSTSRWDAWMTTDGRYMKRDLSTYRFIRSLKIPVAVGGYLMGAIVILFLLMNRSVRYFDALAANVGRLLAGDAARIDLPADLAVSRAELTEIRERLLRDERIASQTEERKNELVAYLAHDIRTPLTTILGYLAILEESPDLPLETRARYAGIAYGKAVELEHMIGEFFEVARYNLTKVSVERETVDVMVLCYQVAEGFYPEATEKSVIVAVRGPETLEWMLDPEKMARVLSNIMRNALAFARAGTEIGLDVSQVEEELTLSITNEGVEIPEHRLETIFEKFYREDASRSTTTGGSGLGLAISKELVEAHGGTISATSGEGVTTFTVTVPR